MKLPEPDPSAKAHSEKLYALIKDEIMKHGGAITFARFMELALFAPQLGYYMADHKRFGEKGDFVTAPELSPLFAKTIAKQCQQILMHLPQGDILELGAGSGVFAKDLLLELQRLNALPTHYYILEISPALRAQQKKLLKTSCPDLCERVIWLDALPTHMTGIIIANEVLDALPVHLFRVINDEIKERFVAYDQGQFVWQDQDSHDDLKKLLQDFRFQNEYESEINLMLPRFITSLANSLKQGVILLLDYGYGREEYYHPDRTMGTLKCYYQHHTHDNPFILVGLQDITAHVDFTVVVESACDAGLSLAGYTTQAAFLLALGLLQLAENENISELERIQQNQAIKKLTLPAHMGEAIKVMALSKQFAEPLLGFALQDRRGDL